jgi:hypothetical protein
MAGRSGSENEHAKFDLTTLTERERLALAYVARRKIETNRYPLSPQLAPLKSALAKLAPADPEPKPPATPRRKPQR